jgi:eukaryotic-like serine/threonine-protein kinase
MSDPSEQQLGNYRLIGLLGKGGFADVYLGEHVYLKTQAAIKVLHAQITQDNLESFITEAQTIGRLRHPHIIRVLDFGVQNNTPFLVMDYAPRGTLRQCHPKGSQLPLATILTYVKQLTEALQYAHNEKLIHRDIKPENMLLDPNDEILLSDFGIATISRGSRTTSTHDIAGTVLYMAPEQIQGKPRPASDQYALGIVIYEWLTGSCPFGGTFTEIATQHMIVSPVPLRVKIPTISPDVEQVVLKALNKEPTQRFPTVQAFANALKQAINADELLGPQDETFIPSSEAEPTLLPIPVFTPPTVDTPSVLPRNTEPPVVYPLPGASNIANIHTRGQDTLEPGKHRISRRLVIASLVGIAAASAGITWLAFAYEQTMRTRASTSATQPHLTAISRPNPTFPPVLSTPFIYRGHNNTVYTVAWSPDSSRIASAGIGATVQVWDSTKGDHLLVYHSGDTSTTAKVYWVAWSHDGSRIASAHEDGTVQVWNALSGTLLAAYRGHIGHVNSVAWSPDNTRIASGGHDATAKVWDVATGKLLFTYRKHSKYVNAVTWSPDGKLIASASGDATVQVWTSANGKYNFTYSGHSDQVEAVSWSPDGNRLVSGSLDNTAQVWSANSGTSLRTYRAHSNYVLGVSWAPDSTHIVSCSQDTTAQVWTATSGNTLHTYRGHSNVVEGVAWSPDAILIASASDDRTVQVWRAT